MRVFIASVFIFLACSSNGNPTAIKVTELAPKPATRVVEPSSVVVISAPSVTTAKAEKAVTCAQACANMAKLKHPAATKHPKGVTCESVCKDVQASKLIKWNLKCRAGAKTKRAVDQCER